ncbi:motility associated factor glycosyltransferase family protein [Alteromonas sp. 5E99-2]|uniref:motility associated factor glycosyltransferase family protein n=1 Tax=Alteromonas sp. 5E99-2 TaxID=2817683 RepID=UPI001A994A93|nr:6-hydroxymethylpterin diphosphokinase MptE-like protein [Alteromonas sp. 5E99-2]MBO1255241.1 motility associated factor glycosyltransferase family protein [Alteromonas sp. 5E99-2]
MLDDIRLHIYSDEEKQSDIEQHSAIGLTKRFEDNKRAFFRFAPGLKKVVEQSSWQNYGLFFNKNKNGNLVDGVTGTVLYGVEPNDEIHRQVNKFKDAPIRVYLDANGAQSSQVTDSSCLVILGLGLGYHLNLLIEETNSKFIIIYEPETQFLLGSSFLLDWQIVLKRAEEKGITLFFQIGESGEKIKSDLKELREHCSLKFIDFYQHYNNAEFLSIIDHAKFYNAISFFEYAIEWQRGENWSQYIPIWTPPPKFEISEKVVPKDHSLFKKNIETFRATFSEIALQFENYKSQRWEVVESKENEVALRHIETGLYFCSELPRDAGKSNYNNFAQYPNKDGLVLGYNGTKLLPYLHYQFVDEVGVIIEQLDDKVSTLPSDIKSLILFGIVNGYHLDELLAEHTIDALLVCEPEPDFFYAALFAIDFKPILDDFNHRQARLYFNIGDDGSHLYSDLIHQFHAIGPYVLQDTYFYQAYSRRDFADRISSLREQLQVVVSAGEYFDHVRYGIEHTRHVLKNECFVQRTESDITYPGTFDETPVFIVGNGPSLDKEIDYISSVQERVIIVSCGTSIGTLAKFNIKPDIHVEIEQNRSTYDWLQRADCKPLLAETILLSCNGIHPHVTELFKDVFMCLKQGESSTEVTELAIGRNVAEILENAYPTVSNLALNAIIKLKLKNIFLFGVDLAFLSDTEHHSSHSQYYNEKGQEVYDYAKSNQLNIFVPGNFGGFLKTKYEFKLSKNCMESLLSNEGVECFNCSHGALIEGAKPIRSDELTLPEIKLDKSVVLDTLKEHAFYQSKNLLKQVDSKDILSHFSLEKVEQDIELLLTLLSSLEARDITIDTFILKQKQLLIDFYNNNSLSFYLFYGSNNYALSVFSKFSQLPESDFGLEISLISAWRRFLCKVKIEYANYASEFDFIHSFGFHREKIIAHSYLKSVEVYVNLNITNCPYLLESISEFKTKNMNFHFSSDEFSEYSSFVFIINNENIFDKIVYTLSRQNEPKDVLIVDVDIHIFKRLKAALPAHRINLLISPFHTKSKDSLDDFYNGTAPLHYDANTLKLVPKVINGELDGAIYVPKLLYSTKATLELIKNQTLNLIENLGEVLPQFYVFPDYCCFNAKLPNNYVDILGSFAKPAPIEYSQRDLVIIHLLSDEKLQGHVNCFHDENAYQWTIKSD